MQNHTLSHLILTLLGQYIIANDKLLLKGLDVTYHLDITSQGEGRKMVWFCKVWGYTVIYQLMECWNAKVGKFWGVKWNLLDFNEFSHCDAKIVQNLNIYQPAVLPRTIKNYSNITALWANINIYWAVTVEDARVPVVIVDGIWNLQNIIFKQ